MNKKKLHYSTITPLLHDVLKTLMAARQFNTFRLVGGTSLSLQRGHRKSEDIDLFTAAHQGSIDFEAIDSFLRDTYEYVDTLNIKIVGMGRSYTVGKNKDESVKLDLFYTDEFIQDALIIDGIRLATVEEIIAMKLEVISRIGRKKDFWDIYELIEDYSLTQMIALHEKRYPYAHDVDIIKKNFTDFSKADKDADPVCLRHRKWELIKLDIKGFIHPKINTIIKVAHTPISLNANEPFELHIQGGIDYFNTLLCFRYNKSLHYKQITLTLKNETGETYSTPLLFDEQAQKSFFLISELSEHINNPIFSSIEFLSKEEMRFEFWAEDQEGGFTDL